MAVKRAANGADRKPEKNPLVSVSRPLVVEGLEEDGVAKALGGRRAERAMQPKTPTSTFTTAQ